MILREIPRSWLIAFFLAALVIIRVCGYDSYVTASLAAIASYLFGYHQGTATPTVTVVDSPPPQ